MNHNNYTFMLCVPARLTESELMELAQIVTESAQPFISNILESRKNNVVPLKVINHDDTEDYNE